MINIHVIEIPPQEPRRFATEIFRVPSLSPVTDATRLVGMLIRANHKIERLRRSVSLAAEQIVRAGELLRQQQARIDTLEKDKEALIRALHRASH